MLADLPSGLSRSAGSQQNIVLVQKRGQPVLLIQPHTFHGEQGNRSGLPVDICPEQRIVASLRPNA